MREITRNHLPKRINNPMRQISPVGIILHYVGNPATTAKANAKYFHNVNAEVSVNYIVDDFDIIEIIPPHMKSYGTKSGKHNDRYIQIEMCHPDSTGQISKATLDNTVWLCAKLMCDFEMDDILRHYDVTGKRCPRWYVYHQDEWLKLKKWIKGERDKMTYEQFCAYMERYKAEIGSQSVSEYAEDAWELICKMGVMDGTKPKSPLTREQLAVVLKRTCVVE